MRLSVLLLGFSFCLTAQIQDLATTDDGSVLYFSTPYRLRGSTDVGYSKIFRYANNEFQLFREIGLTSDGVDTNFYLAGHPSVSGDGRTIVYTASRGCVGGSHCLFFVYNRGFVASASGADRILSDGTLTLSPDGRYVLISATGNPYAQYDAAWSDLSKGAVINLSGLSVIGDGRQGIANGGTILLSDNQGPLLWNQGQIQRLSFSATPTQARLSADPQEIIYEAAPVGGNYELHSYFVATGQDQILATGAGAPADSRNLTSYFHPSLTNDGFLVAYVLYNQLVVQATHTLGVRQLVLAAEGFTDLVISGSGNLVYAVTSSDRLLRADVTSGAITELSAAVPHIQIVSGVLVPGARVDLSVSSAPARAPYPAILSDAGPAPIIARFSPAITFQIPWKAQVGSTVKLFVPGNPSAFEEDDDNPLQFAEPQFYALPLSGSIFPPYALAAHQDFSALVTDQNPAKIGEVVHLYFTGLGMVAPAIATGLAAPISPLYRLVTAFSCQFQQGSAFFPADILFAGLAPLVVGVERVDMRIPSGLTVTNPEIDCVSADGNNMSESFAQIAVQP
jgi:uncharacterized protein (TIGR03437 family)